MPKQYGTQDGSSLVLQPGYPHLTQLGINGWKIEYRWICNMESALGLVPAWRSVCPLAGFSNHHLTGLEIQGLGDPPGWCSVEATYTYREGTSVTSSVHTDGEVRRSSSSVHNMLPIDDPQLLSLYTQGEIDEAKKTGHTSMGYATIEYNYTTYVEAFTWNEASLTLSAEGTKVGKVGNPTDLASVSDDKWLYQGRTVREDGELIETTDTWWFNEGGWNQVAGT